MNDRLLSSAEAGRRLGVSASSVKRWADAGVLPCVLTPGGHRRFESQAVESFLREAARTGAPDAGTDDARLADSWVDVLLTPNEPMALEARLLDARGRLGSWTEVATELGSALVELGRRWSTGTVSILDEHAASERLARALARWSERLPPRTDGPRVLLALADGERHALGLRLAELCLREAGWWVRWAGESTPAAELLEAARSGGIDALGLSAAVSHPDPSGLQAQARALDAACAREGVALLLGGGGPWPDDLPHARRLRTLQDLRSLLDAERVGSFVVRR